MIYTVPRLTLPGTIEVPEQYQDQQANNYALWPTVVNIAEADSDDVPSSSRRRNNQSKLACIRCRSKKIKCDGSTPCNRCIQASQDCSFDGEDRRKTDSAEKALMEKLSMLQSRHDALASGQQEALSSVIPDDSLFSIPWTPELAPHIEARITTDIRDNLLKIALTYLPRCNFNIDPRAIFGALHLSPAQQPHPALLNALMLLGTFYAVSNPEESLPVDCPPPEYFIQEIRVHQAKGLADGDRLMHCLTASLILPWYQLMNGEFLAGAYQLATTARLAISCGLHQIDGQTVQSVLYPVLVPPPPRQASSILGPPASVQDLDMRISVFWGIYMVDKSISLMTGFASSFDERVLNPDLQITTVFPRRHGHFGDPWNPDDFSSVDDLLKTPQIPSDTLRIFKSVPTPETVVGAYSQGVTLIYQAVRLARASPQNIAEALELRNSLKNLNKAISRFGAQLPQAATMEAIKSTQPPYVFGAFYAPLAFFALAEVRSTVFISTICSHQAAEQLVNFEGGRHGLADGFDMGEHRKMEAAHATTTTAGDIMAELGKPDCDLTAKDGLCIGVGYLWTTVSVVYIEHIVKLRRNDAGDANQAEIQLCSTNLSKLLTAIRILSRVFPVLDLQLQKLELMVEESIGDNYVTESGVGQPRIPHDLNV